MSEALNPALHNTTMSPLLRATEPRFAILCHTNSSFEREATASGHVWTHEIPYARTVRALNTNSNCFSHTVGTGVGRPVAACLDSYAPRSGLNPTPKITQK